MNTQFVSPDEVLVLHRQLLGEFGGEEGLRDQGALEAALLRPQLSAYDSIQSQAAALLEALISNHPFVDGNRRVAFFATDVFLRLNGHYLDCNSNETYVHWMGLLEAQDFDFEQLLKWVEAVVKPLSSSRA